MKSQNPSPSPAAAVELSGVCRRFGLTEVIRGLDLSIKPGEFVALLGPSGSGKSTLLRLAAGLDVPDEGVIRVPGTEALGQQSVVFQEPALLPWRTTLGNVTFPLELLGEQTVASAATAAREALSAVGLGDALGKFPAQLSGGMKMRAALARALVTRPKLLLLDEPFAAVDENTRFALQEQLRALWRELRMTVIFVTHSASEAVFLSTRAVLLSERPARILMDRPIDLPEERGAALRTDPRLIAHVRALSEAFPRYREAPAS